MTLYIFNKSSKAAVFGIGTYFRELTDALRHRNINICVINLWSNKPQIRFEEVDGIRYWYFPEPIQEQRTIKQQKQLEQLYQRNIVYLLQLHIEDKRDLIFQLNYMDSKQLADSLKAVFDCKIVLVVHYLDSIITLSGNISRLRSIIQTNDLTDERGLFVKESLLKEKELFNSVDKIICLSNYMNEILCRDYRLDPEKISVISNGLVDAADTVINIKYLRKKWNIPIKEKILLFVGRLDEVKGLKYLLYAFRDVLSTYPQSRLVIAGSGTFDSYIKKSQEICTRITYTGILDKAQLYEWYCLSDVGAMPSLYEPFGYVAVEMMMHGLPIVATTTSGLNEVVDESCGLKVPVVEHADSVEIDTKLLADKIIYLMRHPKEAKNIGQNGRKRYLNKYSSEVFGENMLDFYRSLY